jgi:Cu(I)/Ag(I) efflux system protein CusF
MKNLFVMIVVLSVGAALAVQAKAQSMDKDAMKGHGTGGAAAAAQEESSSAAQGRGVIHSVDLAGRSVNITHEPIPALSWPAMTMDIPVADKVDLSGLNAGDRVDFRIALGADNVYRITELTRAK